MADIMTFVDATPSHDQAIRMRSLSMQGKLTPEAIEAVMSELKPNQREKISFHADRIKQYLPKGMPPKQTEEYVIQALEFYSRHREQQRGRDEAR